jgi:hypothetical protein
VVVRGFALAAVLGLPGVGFAAGTGCIAGITGAAVTSAEGVGAATDGLSADVVVELSDERASIQRFAPNPAAANTRSMMTTLRVM